MILLGAIANAIAILIGALLGRRFKHMRESMSQTVMQGIGLVVALIGITMALKTDRLLLVLISVVLGAVLGSWLKIEERLEDWSKRMEERFGEKNEFANSFVTGVLVFCVGPMAILGSLDSGLRNHHDILFTKSLIDGFTAMIFSSTLGVGVLFSAIPVLLYQGLLTIGSSWVTQLVGQNQLDLIILQLTSVGGILIIAIGCNLLKITSIKVANLLPSLLIAVIATPFIPY